MTYHDCITIPEVKIKSGNVVSFARFPVGICHGELVEVSEEWLDHAVLLTKLSIALLAVLGRPGAEHGALFGAVLGTVLDGVLFF